MITRNARQSTPGGITKNPALLIDRMMGMIDRMAEAMWQDESVRETGRARTIKWAQEDPLERERWTRRATAAFLTLIE